MESIKQYQTVVNEVLDDVGAELSSPNDPIETQYIRDHEGRHYLLFSNGWKGVKRIYGCFLHMDIAKDGKVWLQHDGTDLVVAQMLLDKGIPKSQLVLAFHHPNLRPDTGLAVA